LKRADEMRRTGSADPVVDAAWRSQIFKGRSEQVDMDHSAAPLSHDSEWQRHEGGCKAALDRLLRMS
jgi:hypothetical protein